MRRIATVGLLCSLVAWAVACDSEQPAQADARVVQILIEGSGARLQAFEVFDMFQDNDGDTVADDIDGDGDADIFLWCQFPTPPRPSQVGAVSVPWNHGIEISLIRAGSSARTPLTSGGSAIPTANLTPLDTAVTRPQGTLARNPISVTDSAGVPRLFRFINGRVLSALNRDVLASTTNPLHEIRPAVYDGLCRAKVLLPGASAPQPTLDGDDPPFTGAFNKGDTLVVEAVRSNAPPGGYDPNVVSLEPVIRGRLFVDGREVGNLEGAVTDRTPGAGFSFSFTLR